MRRPNMFHVSRRYRWQDCWQRLLDRLGWAQPALDRHRARARPVLEGLEDRTAPATTITWNNPAGGDWDTASNWSPQIVPGSGDDVVIIPTLNSGASVTHSNNVSDSVASITASAPIILSGGTLTVAGNFSDTSTVTLSGGTLGNATLVSGTIVNVTASSTMQAVTVAGTVDVAIGTLSLTGGSSTAGNFSISSGATLGFDGNYTLDSASSVSGTGAAEFGSGTVNFPTNGTPYDVSGGLTVDGGTVTFGSGDTVSGNVTVSSGTANFNTGASATSLGALTISGGTANFSTGANVAVTSLSLTPAELDPIANLTGSDTVTVAGTTTWSAGFAATATMSGTGRTITQGQLNLPSNGFGSTLSLAGRTLDNAGSANFSTSTPPLTLSGGAVILNDPNATWTLESGASISSGTGGGTFINEGTFISAGGANSVGVTFDNGFNNGTMTLPGAVNVTAGTLNLTGGGSSTGASSTNSTMTISPGATLGFDGNYTLDSASSVSGTGAAEFGSGTVNFPTNGTPYDVTGGLTVDGGTVTFGSGDTVSGNVTVSSGTANFNTGASATSLGALTISGGTANFSTGTNVAVTSLSLTPAELDPIANLTGSDTVTVAGTTTWSAGFAATATMSGTGRTITQGQLNLPSNGFGSTLSLAGRTLDNAGSANFSTSTPPLTLSGGAVILNDPNATWTLESGASISSGTGGGTFINEGTFISAGGANSVGVTFDNGFNNGTMTLPGAVNVTAGTLNLTGGGSSTGASSAISTMTISPGATLGFDGNYTLDSASSVSGTGAAEFGSGTVNFPTNGTPYDVTGGLTVDGGTVTFGSGDTVSGNVTVSSGTANFNTGASATSLGALTISGGTANFSTGTNVAVTSLSLTPAELDPIANLTGSDTVTVAGTTTWSAGFAATATMSGTGRTITQGQLNLPSDGFGSTLSLAGRTLENAGSANFSTSTAPLTLSGGAVILNDPSATWALESGASISSGTGGGTFINEGTFISAGGANSVGVAVTNTGEINATAGNLSLSSNVTSNQSGFLADQPGATISVAGNLVGATVNGDDYSPRGAVMLAGTGTPSSPQLLEAMSDDLGNVAAGFVNNFAYGELALSNNTYVELVNNLQNSSGAGPEAVYVGALVVPSGTTLNLNGLHVYARVAQIGGTVVGGNVSVLGDGGALQFSTLTPGDITTSGQVDDWTFFGRAGGGVTVVASSGSGSQIPPLSPALNFVQVQLVDPNGNIVATAVNSTSGGDAILLGETLPVDGTYKLLVQAAPGHISSTGNYVLTLWDATVHAATLNLNETTVGQLATPYSVDHWTFAAMANEQIKFNLINVAQTGIEFDLTGPNGYTAFSGASASSGLLNLPSSGNYTLTVHALQPSAGAYAFSVALTSVTALSSAVPYNGVFAGSGQPQLFTIVTPDDEQLLINFQDSNLGDQIAIYAQHGVPPTPAAYQYESALPGSAGQTILVPTAAPGTWYILVDAETVAAPPQGFTLTATVSPLTLTAVTPTRLGNAADAVLTLNGGGFDATTTVSLVAADGTTYQANQNELILATQLSATFTAGAVPAGVYSVVVTRGDGFSATLTNAFTMDQGGAADFTANLVTPSSLGYHVASTLYLEYSNTGDLAMPAPFLQVTITQTHSDGTTTQDALLTLDPSLHPSLGLGVSFLPAGFSHTIQVLASGATPGVLEPGESESMPIYYAGWERPYDFNYPNFDPQVGVSLPTDTTPIPWSALQSSFQPASLNTTAWNAVYPAVQALVGSTWGDFVQAIDNAALYLDSLGENVNDVNQLWSFVVQEAAGFSVIPILSSMTDAQVATPGPALSVDRVFPNYIDARSQLGPFGYGWSVNDQWEQSLYVAPAGSADAGTVTIVQDGMPAVFTPNSSGGYNAMAGVNAKLTTTSGGSFLLQENNGEMTAFNPTGQVASIEDTNGNTVTAGYTNGLLTSLTASTGQSLTLAYNSAGRVTSITDSTGRTTTYTYDPTNQYLLSVTDFAGRTTGYTYDTSGHPTTENALLSVQNPDGTMDEFTYDAEGRLATTYTTSATISGVNSGQITYAYGPGGKVALTDADNGTTQFYFNNLGFIVKMVDPLGNATHHIYDQNYNLSEVIDPAGQISSYVYDQNGNLAQYTNPDGATVNFTNTGPFNNLTSYTDADGNTTNYAYNKQGDLLSITYPNQTEQQFSYDPVGDLTETINGSGQAVKSTYNSIGLVTQTTFADGTTASYTYDSHGNMLTATNSTGTTSFQYDPVTEDLLDVSYPGGFTLTFTYDSAGRRVKSVDQTGFTVNYAYNSAGLLAGLTDGNGNSIVSYTYDAAGKLIEKLNGNGTYTTYQYDLAGNLLHLVNSAPGGAVNSRFDYTYNNLGLQASETTLDGVWTYQYDPAGQLTQAIFASNNTGVVPNQSLQYLYDPAGNRTETIINGVTTQYVTNNMNQYTQVGSTTYAYDADGNLVAQTGSAGTTNYTYNELDELTGVSSPASTSTYQYNALGQLASMTQNGQTTQYVVDPIGLGNVVGTYNGSGGLSADYTYGLGLTSQVPAGGQAAYYDFDALGSTAGISGTSGAYLNVYRYLPFGVSLTSSGSISNPFQFVGQLGVMTQANGLNFMRARFYASGQGQFLSRDPLGLASGQTNLYVYAGQNPLSYTDPTGLNRFGGLGGGSSLMDHPSCTFQSTAQLADLLRKDQQTIDSDNLGINGAEQQANEGILTPEQLVDYVREQDAAIAVLELDIEQITVYLNLPKCPPPPPKPPPPPPGPAHCTKGVFPYGFDMFSITYDMECPPNPSSHDPNAASGPLGFGAQGFIADSGVLPYRIDFENDPTATAPAKTAVITDQLNPNLDWSTFQFTEVGFGSNVITIPAGRQFFQTTVPMTYNDETFDVVIDMELNAQTGLVTVTFQSIDPKTGLFTDVLTGFLPPEDGSGRGMGYFSYTIQANAGVPSGTQITNVALVTFDSNQPIATDQVSDSNPGLGVDPTKQCLNTIDSAPPTSSVLALPADSPPSFTVSWSGQDDTGGSGLAAYYVYVSDDGGPYTQWQTWSTQTSAVYPGQAGHTYSFYSVAVDNVNNTQPTPAAAQATTEVDATPPTSTVAALPASSPTSFTVSWSGSDNAGGSGLASYQVFVSDNGGPFTLWQAATTQTSATYTGTPGHTYGFYSIATDNVGNVQPTPAGAEATTTVASPPTTSASLTGTLGTGGVYTSPVTVTLTATDSNFPVADTYYSLDGGTTWLNYTAAFTVSAQGTTTIEYYSVDLVGNMETIESASFKIDSVAPTTTAQLSGTAGTTGWYTSASVQVALTASDATSGVAATYYTVDGGSEQIYGGSPFSVTGDGVHQITFWSVDNAGNIEAVESDTIRIDTASIATVSVQPPSSVTAGNDFGLTIEVEDDKGNVDSVFDGGVILNLSRNPGGSTLGGNLTANVIDGVATFSGLTLNKAGIDYKLSATADGLPVVVTNAFAVTAAAASQLVVTSEPPPSVSIGAGAGFVVAAEDPFGNVDPTFNGKVTVSLANNPDKAKLGGTLSATAINGLAVFDGPTLNKLGTGYTLQATTPKLTDVTTNGISVVSSSYKARVIHGSGQSSAVATTVADALQVAVIDAKGKPAGNVPVTFTIIAGGAGAAFTSSGSLGLDATVETNSAGVATAVPALTANTIAGSYFVSVSVQDVVIPALISETNKAGTPASIDVTNGGNQSATVGSSFAHPLQVIVKDQYGNVVPNAAVTLAAPTSGASGTFSSKGSPAHVTVKTNAAGLAIAPAFNADKVAGSYVVTASVGGLKSSFAETNAAGAPAVVTVVKGGLGQKTSINTAFTEALEVAVTDRFGNVLADVPVTFTAPTSKGASGTFATTGSPTQVVVNTNAAGVATAPPLVANDNAGSFIVTASVAGVKKLLSFPETNVD